MRSNVTHNSMWGMPGYSNTTCSIVSSFENLDMYTTMNSTNTAHYTDTLWSYWLTTMSFVILICKMLLWFVFGCCLVLPFIHQKRIVKILGDITDKCVYYMYYRKRNAINSTIISNTTEESHSFRSRRVFLVDNLPSDTTVETLKNFFSWKKNVFDEVIEIAAAPNNKSKRTALISLPVQKTETSRILEYNKRSFKGNPLKITEIKNRKHSFTKNFQWICKKPSSFSNTLQRTEVPGKLWENKHCPEFSLVDAGSFMINISAEVQEVIQRASNAGIEKMVLKCSNMKESYKAARLCEKYPGYLYFTAGIDSAEVKDNWEKSLEPLESLAKHKQCVAIGETGLDFDVENLNITKQIKAFRAQIELACRLKKPLHVTVSGVYDDECVSILKKYRTDLPPCSILDYDCFAKNKYRLWEYLQLGCYVTVMGSKLHGDSKWLVNTLKNNEIPLNRIILESSIAWTNAEEGHKTLNEFRASFKDPQDTMYLTEANFNLAFSQYDYGNPCCLPFTLELVASALKCPTVKLAAIVNDNAHRLYNLN